MAAKHEAFVHSLLQILHCQCLGADHGESELLELLGFGFAELGLDLQKQVLVAVILADDSMPAGSKKLGFDLVATSTAEPGDQLPPFVVEYGLLVHNPLVVAMAAERVAAMFVSGFDFVERQNVGHVPAFLG